MEERTRACAWCSECTSLSPVARFCHCRPPPSPWSAVSVHKPQTPNTHTHTNPHVTGRGGSHRFPSTPLGSPWHTVRVQRACTPSDDRPLSNPPPAQRSAQELPQVEKSSLASCLVSGGEEMVISGSNFFPESKVIFLEKGPGKSGVLFPQRPTADAGNCKNCKNCKNYFYEV